MGSEDEERPKEDRRRGERRSHDRRKGDRRKDEANGSPPDRERQIEQARQSFRNRAAFDAEREKERRGRGLFRRRRRS